MENRSYRLEMIDGSSCELELRLENKTLKCRLHFAKINHVILTNDHLISTKLLFTFKDVFENLYKSTSSWYDCNHIREMLETLNIKNVSNQNGKVEGWSWSIFKQNIKKQLKLYDIVNEVEIVKHNPMESIVRIKYYGVDSRYNSSTNYRRKYLIENQIHSKHIEFRLTNIIDARENNRNLNSRYYFYNKNVLIQKANSRLNSEDKLIQSVIKKEIKHILDSYKGSKK